MQIAAGHDLSITFVTETLFSSVSFSVESGAHIGLVGLNGSGKSTLFRIISKEIAPSSGQMIFSRECRIAYMKQFLDAAEDETLYQAVEHVFSSLIDLETRIDELNQRLESELDTSLLAELSRLLEQYADGGGYTFRTRLRSTLIGLGFSENDLQLPVRSLSGGQRSKAALAKVLLSDANLLLLDEPTNHLDIESIQWLENYLSNLRTAFIVISHDRYFLDKVTNETWDMHHGRMQCYSGNYTEHLLLRDGEEESVRRRYHNQMREIRRIESIIAQQRRFNQARNYVTIASKEKQIARLKQDLVAPEGDERTLHFDFNTPLPGGNDVLELYNVEKSFGSKHLFRGIDMHINKGERIFLLGPNGCGKSTLMKIIIGYETTDKGMVKLGINIFPTYYDQLHGHLSGNRTILQYFTDTYPRLTQTKIRTMLGSFLFPADEVDKTLDMLSGGEKARLELMKLILEPANFLLLDEPSNHLDIASMEAVEQALLAYPGAMLIISHDRYLINKLADRIYYLSPDSLIESLGDYEALQNTLTKHSSQLTAPTKDVTANTAENDYRRRKEEQAAARKRQNDAAKAENQLAQKEAQLAQVDAKMNAPENMTDYQLLMELQAQKNQLESDCLELMEKLEELQ